MATRVRTFHYIALRYFKLLRDEQTATKIVLTICVSVRNQINFARLRRPLPLPLLSVWWEVARLRRRRLSLAMQLIARLTLGCSNKVF